MSGETGGVTLDLLGALMRDMQKEMRDMRAEQRDMRSLLHEQHTLLMLLAEQGRRLDRHVTELKDEFELMIKAEVMGRIGNFETQVGHRLDRIEERVSVLEGADRPQ